MIGEPQPPDEGRQGNWAEFTFASPGVLPSRGPTSQTLGRRQEGQCAGREAPKSCPQTHRQDDGGALRVEDLEVEGSVEKTEGDAPT